MGDIDCVDNLPTKEPSAHFNVDVAKLRRCSLLLALHLFDPVDAALLFCAARLCAFLQPCEFCAEFVPLVISRCISDGDHGFFAFEVRLVRAVVGEEAVLIELDNARTHSVEEVSIVRHQQESA